MPKKVQFLSYAIRVCKYGGDVEDDSEDLTTWPDADGFAGVIRRCFDRTQSSPLLDKASEKVILDRQVLGESGEAHKISAILGGGVYGETGKIVDSRSGDHRIDIREEDTNRIPFYFQFRAFPERKFGFFLVQKYGRRGIKTPFEKILRCWVREQHGSYTVNFNPHAPSDYILRLISGGLREVRFIKRKVTGDDFDRNRFGQWEPDSGKREIKIQADTGETISLPNWMPAFISGGTSHAQLEEIIETRFDDLKVTTRVGDSERTITLTEEQEPVAKFDVSGEVQRRGGHPTAASIHATGDDHMSALIQDAGVA